MSHLYCFTLFERVPIPLSPCITPFSFQCFFFHNLLVPLSINFFQPFPILYSSSTVLLPLYTYLLLLHPFFSLLPFQCFRYFHYFSFTFSFSFYLCPFHFPSPLFYFLCGFIFRSFIPFSFLLIFSSLYSSS